MKFYALIVLFILMLSGKGFAGCNEAAFQNNNDPLAHALKLGPQCPRNVQQLRSLLFQAGFRFYTTMVNNRGYHNPLRGSFSLFEMAVSESWNIREGEFFFGHFTKRENNQLKLAQDANQGLLIEVIVFDRTKQVFNFYELIGSQGNVSWVYRGDSSHILYDVKKVHLVDPSNEVPFNRTLRCSGCHLNGGPIMKELNGAHNDWWTTQRPLTFGGLTPDEDLNGVLRSIVDAEYLANGVKRGMTYLQYSPNFRNMINQLSLQERLRPLFCPMEVNFEHDPYPLDETNELTYLPIGHILDHRFSYGHIEVSKVHYQQALANLNFFMRENQRRDADHAWLVPVKSTSDKFWIDMLIRDGLIDEEFVFDVLAIDFTNPVFSYKRCRLLNYLPPYFTVNWKQDFYQRLSSASDVSANLLAQHFSNPQFNKTFHVNKTQTFLHKCQVQLRTSEFVGQMLGLAAQRRLEVAANSISQNPLGQILEPGFRIIFPETQLPYSPYLYNLTEDCTFERQY